MSTLEKLIKHFERFPGIGSRQARRFVYHLLTENEQNITELATLIGKIKESVATCESCMRFFVQNGEGNLCQICSNSERDSKKLMVVEQDSDIQAVERSGTYDGLYFVLGGSVPLLESEETKKLNGSTLKQIVKNRIKNKLLSEIILAFSVNPDGENTARYVRGLLADYIEKKNIKVSLLGRGLSTGSELEYADPETIKSALENRA